MPEEMTLLMVKPELLTRADEVYRYFDRIGRRLSTVDVENITFRQIADFYASTIEKHEAGMILYLDYFVGKNCQLALYEGKEGLIVAMRKVLGHTDPKRAGRGTLRGDLCTDSHERALLEKRAVLNGAHVSDSKREFQEQFNAFKDFFSKNDRLRVARFLSRY
ncbi:hypothetical protein FJZ19_05670 [Candidatus Pacearchaeota archaeon]|nr:hypothetical protein [Candidatus Pacearchaeota archaeon]